MLSRWSWFSIIAFAAASPIRPAFLPREQANSNESFVAYTLPQSSTNPLLRAAAIVTKQATFLYGPAVAGGPFYPSGALGLAQATVDEGLVGVELAAQGLLVANDSIAALTNTERVREPEAPIDVRLLTPVQYDGLETIDDYTKLYDGLWQPSSAPTGQDAGMLTNYTQDLLFSMERLSINPYSISRLDPSSNSSLPFTVGDDIVQNITGQSLDSLFISGRLFYVDYRAQGALPRSPQFAPASDAYFYVSPSSGEFLPLAIRTNFGSNLIYTPADTATDWLLAKIMYNTNDFFFGQIHHLANTHYVSEIVYEAAVRTLSDDHPVLAILARLMYGAFGIRPLAALILLPPGGQIDQFFGFSGAAASTYATDLYDSGFAGSFQDNYFFNNLQRRGLINATTGPELTHFPFYEDALPIYEAIHAFMGTFVNAYYSSDATVSNDTELQAWAAEANGPAKAIDFPTALQSRDQLVDVLTHVAHLVSSAHHAVNTNELITGSGVLPFHPSALYQQVPDSKGVSDIVPFLPPLSKCIGLLMSQGNFARPLIAGTNRTLVHMFNDDIMLARMNDATRGANQQFMAAMMAQSQVVSSRSFDANGLSQGMPFVWKGLDPNVAPWSLTI